MKFKVTTLAILMTVVSCLEVFGQDRVNRQKLSFLQNSGVLTQATGWAYNSTLGEWVDYKNVISDDKDYKDKYKVLQGAYMMSNKYQNFLKIQTKAITYNSINYYILILDKWNGDFQYPAIREDWYEFKETIGYIFTKSEYDKLAKLEGIVELKTKNSVTMGSKYEKYDETKFLDLIQTELSERKSDWAAEYTFPITKSKEGAIRFLIPENFSTHSKYDFGKEYFEIDFANFSKIFIK